ncbi:MAG: FadR/GntR family transcriptional regulator [Gammaproteobacteria bacterium]|nr:FadR/GntR family transcriptional regulator [Gammaproteobacteria bacterium]
MAIDFKPLQTQSLAAQIADRIRQSIVEGRLGADDRLPGEAELAAQFDVSRPTIREALKRLAAQHLIRSRRGPAGGTFVNRPSHQELRDSLTGAAVVAVSMGEFAPDDIAEARRELELLCCRLAAANRRPEHLQAMAAEIALQSSEELSDEDFCASDVRFHRALVDATGNKVLQLVMFSVIEALQPVINLVIFRFRERAQIVGFHQRILDALTAGDSAAAAAALAAQMQYLEQQVAVAQQWRRDRQRNR